MVLNLKLQLRAVGEISETCCLIRLLEWPFAHDFQGHNVFLFSQHTNTVYSLLSLLISIHLRPHFHVQWIVRFSNLTRFFLFGDLVLKTAF